MAIAPTRSPPCRLALALLLLAPVVAAMDLKVYILAGQSNMEGHGVAVKTAGANEGNGTVEWSVENGHWKDLPVCETMADAPKIGCRAEGASFDGLMDDDGNWTVHEDTRVVFRGSRNKTGPLSVGFGYHVFAGVLCVVCVCRGGGGASLASRYASRS